MRWVWIILTFLSLSCLEKRTTDGASSSNDIPPIFIATTDANLSKDQDTLFYKRGYFSGHLFQLYPDADTALNISYLNGLQEGLTKKWYPNQQLAEERWYCNGQKEGVHKAWWQNGNLKFQFGVTHDAYSGELKEWYPSGKLAKVFHYVNGQEEGTQQWWWADGRFRANYVVRNGRKYGSIGVKLCLNPNDSIFKK